MKYKLSQWLTKIANKIAGTDDMSKPYIRSSREQLRVARRLRRQRGDVQHVVNPAGTKLARKAAEGKLTMKWGH